MTQPDRPVTEDDLQAWVDGFLSPERLRTVETWLESHPATLRRVMAWRHERDVLRSGLDPDLKQPVPARFNISNLRQRSAMGSNTPRMAASIALALSIGFGSGWFLRDHRVPVGLAAVEQEAMIVRDASKRSAITEGNVAQLAAWGGRTLGRPVRPPDLSAAGYHLEGGQLVPTDHGPACVFFYKDDSGTRISLFVRPMYGVDVTAPMRPMRHLPGYLWAQDGLGVSMVADTSMSSLHTLADRARDLMAKGS
ncbi:anti-sigma factor [Gluconobacter frateurii]|uniref:anti-sigma factor family protein n=1 Tax=Gluconobacter frateurii TaxID=38308 RepID=UPI001F067AED|nr:anti-sigma factor [Gluconobacter frateurii]UMM07913.1 anti-sigma factor [Gluconobacter frateurii]